MQYQTFSPETEIFGQATAHLLQNLPINLEQVRQLLEKNHIYNMDPTEWYPMQNALNFLKDIEKKYGPNTLFAIGKATTEAAVLPPEVDNVPAAIAALDMGYKLNHRNGNIGYYKLNYFDSVAQKAVLECYTPYPSEFERGFITNFLRKFRRPGSIISVEVDLTKESRLTGGDRCFYNISW